MKRLMGAVGCLALAGCATPNTIRPVIGNGDAAAEATREAEYALQARVGEQNRLDDVAFRLETANQDLCPQRRSRIGLSFANEDTFKPPLHDVAVQVLHLGAPLSVIHVVPKGPADLAGVRVGDEIVSLNGGLVTGGAKANQRFSEQLVDALNKEPTKATLVIRRAGQTQTIGVTPAMACAYEAQVVDAPETNAMADGKRIMVTRPLMKLAATDEELALVVAHELAHNARGHMNAKKKNAAMAGIGGAALDVLAAAAGVNTQGAFTKAAMQAGAGYGSPEFEAEADYVGMYYLARAGFQTDGVENFWRKMGIENPQAIFIKSDHPASPKRYLAIAATNQEISQKRSAGEALLPNEKTK